MGWSNGMVQVTYYVKYQQMAEYDEYQENSKLVEWNVEENNNNNTK